MVKVIASDCDHIWLRDCLKCGECETHWLTGVKLKEVETSGVWWIGVGEERRISPPHLTVAVIAAVVDEPAHIWNKHETRDPVICQGRSKLTCNVWRDSGDNTNAKATELVGWNRLEECESAVVPRTWGIPRLQMKNSALKMDRARGLGLYRAIFAVQCRAVGSPRWVKWA